MTTFYSIHAYNPESRNPGEDKIHDGILYTTFEKACEAINKKIDFYIEYWNNHESDTPEEFKVPNVEEMKKDIEKRKYVNYYECDSGWVWVIRKWEVEEEKPKYTYQYFVEKETRGTVVALKCSEKYSSLDEMLDVLQPEVVKFHLDMRARNWAPYSRQTIREYMERNKRMIYDRVDDDDEGTIAYAIHKYET